MKLGELQEKLKNISLHHGPDIQVMITNDEMADTYPIEYVEVESFKNNRKYVHLT